LNRIDKRTMKAMGRVKKTSVLLLNLATLPFCQVDKCFDAFSSSSSSSLSESSPESISIGFALLSTLGFLFGGVFLGILKQVMKLSTLGVAFFVPLERLLMLAPPAHLLCCVALRLSVFLMHQPLVQPRRGRDN
jgi:hypothetical protein